MLVLAGCDTAGPPTSEPMMDENSSYSSQDVSVRLLAQRKGGTYSQRKSSARHFCIANVMAPGTEAGYQTYELGLSFPDRLDTTGEATTTLGFDLHVTTPGDGAMQAYAEADSSHASRVRCWTPRTEEAIEHLRVRIQKDLEAVFGENGYQWLTEEHAGASAVMGKNMPIDCGTTIATGCEMDGITVTPEEPSDPVPPPPPTPFPSGPGGSTPPAGPGSGGGGDTGDDPSDCSKSSSMTQVPTFLFPRPNEGPTGKRLFLPPAPGSGDDPPPEDNPPPAGGGGPANDGPTSGGDCENDGGEDNGGGEEPSVAEQLADLLRDNPHLLLNVPCETIQDYTELANLPISQEVLSVVADLADIGISRIQYLRDAYGAVVNMDEFAVTTHVDNLPNNQTPEQYLRRIRSNINSYIDRPGVQFSEVVGSMGSVDPDGTVLSISLAGGGWIEEGSVVVSESSSSSWVFTTVYTPFDGSHPVSGNREFGFRRNGDQVTFYTRGVDRMTTPLDRIANTDGYAFSQADALWSSFQDKIKSEIGGDAALSSMVARPNWDNVGAVLSGEMDVSSIEGCDS